MSRWALSNLKASQKHQARQALFFPLTGLKHLALLFAISIFLTFWMANGSVTAEMLFQSPAPAESPLTEPPPAEQPPPAEPAPTEQPPPAEPVPAEQPPVEQQPAEEIPAEASPTDQPATEIISSESPVQEPGGEALVPEEPLPESSRPERSRRDEITLDDEGEESSNLILDQIELIDTIVVSGAYVWLCCGVVLFLLVPVFMLLLYIRGRSRIGSEGDL